MTYYLLLGVISNLILVLGLIFLVPESPEFLAGQHKIKESLQGLKRIADVNGTTDQELLDAIESEDAWESVNDTPNQNDQLSEKLINTENAMENRESQ
eukprot:CAMPEP_0116886874 /NCGR_PEP_ID=MMETSP0463-20121206/20861_1 /TAXON_ID=181622 /ORGANISM="Strombidinopsis sp, Strain SopsisLIS2011" /LENGTH=97 /DNA_ID=CAMNT_0004548005 /DNA_START=719 /DNA_END=1012 /DNA_ORIENTATION=-